MTDQPEDLRSGGGSAVAAGAADDPALPKAGAGDVWPNHAPAVMAAAIIACVLLNPLAHWYGRFWAEEGRYFYMDLRHTGVLAPFTYIYKGTLQLPTNISLWVAGWLPLRYAPLFTTWVGTASIGNLACLLAIWARSQQISTGLTIAGMCAFLVSSSTYEVLSNSTNLQWIFSFAMLPVILMGADVMRQHKAYLLIVVVLAGVSGVPACMLAPIMAIRAMQARSWMHAIFAAILGAGAVLQLWLIASSGVEERSFAYGLPEIVYVSIVRPVTALVLSGKGANVAMAMLYDNVPFLLLLAGSVGAFVGVLVALARMGQARPYWPTIAMMLASWFLVTGLNVFGSLDDGADALRGFSAYRYYLLASFALITILLILSRLGGRNLRHLVVASFVTMHCSNLAYAAITASPLRFAEVPGWGQQVDQCLASKSPSCDFLVWPTGPGNREWTISVERAKVS